MFLRHVPCPMCGSSDAGTEYKDGGFYCFSCKRHGGVRRSGFLADARDEPKLKPLPQDASTEYGTQATQWIQQYGLSIQELFQRGVLWSETRKQLIYTWKNDSGDLLLWQARNFSPTARSKCYTSGPSEDVLPIYYCREQPPRKEDLLVIVEDPVSAMKIARWSDAMPCLGNTLPPNKLKRLVGLYSTFLVWLDSDMLPNTQQMVQRLEMLGAKASLEVTEEDPKSQTDVFIQNVLSGA